MPLTKFVFLTGLNRSYATKYGRGPSLFAGLTVADQNLPSKAGNMESYSEARTKFGSLSVDRTRRFVCLTIGAQKIKDGHQSSDCAM